MAVGDVSITLRLLDLPGVELIVRGPIAAAVKARQVATTVEAVVVPTVVSSIEVRA